MPYYKQYYDIMAHAMALYSIDEIEHLIGHCSQPSFDRRASSRVQCFGVTLGDALRRRLVCLKSRGLDTALLWMLHFMYNNYASSIPWCLHTQRQCRGCFGAILD
jgi:hypothetical protein